MSEEQGVAEAAAPSYPFSAPPLYLPDLISKPVPEVNWAVEDMLTEEDLFLVSGEMGIGKSYVLMDLAIALALGRPFFKRFPVTKAYNVLYIDQEMSHTAVSRRFSRMLKGQHFRSEDEWPRNLHILPEASFKFDGPFSIKSVEWLSTYIREHGINFVLADSVRRFVSGDENDSRTSNLVFERARNLRTKYGCAIGFIAHWNKAQNEEQRGANARVRGSTDWLGCMDAHLAVKVGGGSHMLVIEPSKTRHMNQPVESFFVRFRHDSDPESDPDTPFWLEYDDSPQETTAYKTMELAIRDNPDKNLRELSEITHIPYRNARTALERLRGFGVIREVSRDRAGSRFAVVVPVPAAAAK